MKWEDKKTSNLVETIEEYREMVEELSTIFEQKNKAYGNSYEKSLDEDGLLVAKIRFGDKFNRFSTLIKDKTIDIGDESILDTVMDLANYAIMTAMWIKKNK